MNSTERYQQLLQNPNIRKALDTISWAEGTSGPDGYRTMFGGGTFDVSGGWRHPDRVIHGNGYSSAAAGKYQFMPDTWNAAAGRLGLKDFSPASQDMAALDLIRNRGVDLGGIAQNGLTAGDVDRLAPEWASLPTKSGKSFYGQPVKGIKELLGGAAVGSGLAVAAGGGKPSSAPRPSSSFGGSGGGGGGTATGGATPSMPALRSLMADFEQDPPMYDRSKIGRYAPTPGPSVRIPGIDRVAQSPDFEAEVGQYWNQLGAMLEQGAGYA